MTATVGAVRVPALAAAQPVELDVAQETIPSGLRVLAAARGGAPMVELRLLIPFGGIDPLHPATAELLAVTLLGGTGQRDRGALDTELAGIGATLTASVRPEYLLVSGYVLADGAPRLVRLLADVLTGATYADADVSTQRGKLTYRLRTHAAQPQIIARQALLRRCFGDHPAVREVPREVDLTRVGVAAVRHLHDASVVPRGAALTLVGDLDPPAAVDMAATLLAGWQHERAATVLSTPPRVVAGDVELLDAPGAQQVMVGLAGPAPVQTDPGYPAAYLTNLILGGYFASRLFEHLRETLGYVYTCRSSISQRADSAAVLLEFSTDPTRAADALRETHAELLRITRTGPPRTAEIDAARGFAIGSQAVALSTQGGLADALALLALRGQPLSWPARWLELLAAVSDDQVRDSAAQLFDPATMTGFVHGPAGVLAGALSPLGGRLRPASLAHQPDTTGGGND